MCYGGSTVREISRAPAPRHRSHGDSSTWYDTTPTYQDTISRTSFIQNKLSDREEKLKNITAGIRRREEERKEPGGHHVMSCDVT